MILPKNQWARALVNSNGRCYHRRIDTCKTEKQVKDAPAVVRWGEPPMLKLVKNVVIWSKGTDSERVYWWKKSEYLVMCNLRVYIGGLQLSSRLSALNGILCLDL